MTLIVEKIYREDELESIEPSFGKLINLHLELLENKKKLKAGLPPLIIPKLNLPPVEEQIKEEKRGNDKRGDDKREDKRGEDKEKRKDKSRNRDEDRDTGRRRSRDEKMSKKTAEKDDIANELGDYEDEPPPKEKSDKRREDDKSEDKHDDNKREDKHDDKREDKHDDKRDDKRESSRRDKKEKKDEEAEEPSDEQKQEDSETANMSPEEKEKYEKEEMTWRFRILKKQYKDANIPDFNEHSDLTRMKRAYTRILKELHLDDSVETFRNWLIGGFIVTEWVCTKFVGIDLTGFTKRQICMMKKYDRMLIELGERSYASFGSSLPVEVRLVGFIVIQAGIFYLGKIIADHAGSTVAELFNGLTGQPAVVSHVNTADTEQAPVKKKMKGPSLKASDIKKLKEEVLRNEERNSSSNSTPRTQPSKEPPKREQPKELPKREPSKEQPSREKSESSVKKRHEEEDDDE